MISFLQQNSFFAVFVAVLFGLVIGSFINVIIYRLPIMLYREWKQEALAYLQEYAQTDYKITPLNVNNEHEIFNLATPPSACPKCKRPIKAYENIPVISWLMLSGKCRGCKEPISVRYPLIEISSGILAGFIIYCIGVNLHGLSVMFFALALLSVSIIDIDHKILPDNIVLPLIWFGILLNYFHVITDLESSIIGVIFGYMSLWSIFWLFKIVTGKDGMGYGDFKLLACLGAWGGWQILPITILLSSVIGAIFGVVIMIVQKQDSNFQMPFGPYLATAGLIALLFGADITNMYFRFIGM